MFNLLQAAVAVTEEKLVLVLGRHDEEKSIRRGPKKI